MIDSDSSRNTVHQQFILGVDDARFLFEESPEFRLVYITGLASTRLRCGVNKVRPVVFRAVPFDVVHHDCKFIVRFVRFDTAPTPARQQHFRVHGPWIAREHV